MFDALSHMPLFANLSAWLMSDLAAFVFGVVAAALVRRLLKNPGGPIDETTIIEEDPLRIAYLADETDGAVNLALAVLAVRGNIEIRGELRDAAHALRCHSEGLGNEPLLQDVYTRIDPNDGLNIHSVRWWASPICEGFREEFVRGGYVTSFRSWWFIVPIPMLIASAVPAFQMVQKKSSGWGLLFGLAAICFLMPPHRTRRGDKVLRMLRKKYSAMKLHPTDKWQLAFALFGLETMRVNGREKLANALTRPLPPD